MWKEKKGSTDLQTVFDERLSLAHRNWVLLSSNFTDDEIAKVALCTKYPTLSISAFSLIKDEARKTNTLIKLFGEAEPYTVMAIAYSAIKNIKSQRLLWDIYAHPNTPKEIKPYIEDAINGTGTSIPALSHLIRVGKPKDKFSED